MPNFISDADMEKLSSSQGASTAPKKAKFISDEDMANMENSDHVKAHENDSVIDKIKDPARWQAILNNSGPYKQEVVEDSVPMVVPGSALPRLAKAASAIANAGGIGGALGRTALSTGQGAIMSALDGKEGESLDDKIERVKSGAKLSGGVQAVAESLPIIGKGLGIVGKKIGSAISGVDENILSNYSKRTDQVNDIIKQSGGDMTQAADQVRTELSNGIQKTKSSLNNKISKALEGSKNVSRIDETPILETLQNAKAKLNPNFDASSINEIDDMISTIMAEAKTGRAEGGLSAEGLYKAKQFLNEASKSSYTKDGAIFTRSNAAARAAKEAASDAREAIKTYVPEISEADAQLSRLHQIEGRLNKNLLAAGKPDAALFSAGSGANPRNAATLRELEKVSGVPVSQRAMDLATAKTFANPSLTPSDFTGKIVGRMAIGAGLGYAAGGNEGAAIGGAAASPFAMKLGINAVNVGKQLSSRVPSFAKLIRENPTAAQAIIQLTSGQIKRANPDTPPIPKDAEDYIKENPQILDFVPEDKPKVVSRNPSQLKGEDKWAQDGMNKMGITDPSILESKEAKRLLIEASDLSPGSKRFQAIQTKLKGMGK